MGREAGYWAEREAYTGSRTNFIFRTLCPQEPGLMPEALKTCFLRATLYTVRKPYNNPMSVEHAYVVIMAGGSGTRLWPLSRKNKPKQFQALLSDKNMI